MSTEQEKTVGGRIWDKTLKDAINMALPGEGFSKHRIELFLQFRRVLLSVAREAK